MAKGKVPNIKFIIIFTLNNKLVTFAKKST